MSAIDLLILGEIKIKPQSPYDLSRFVEKNEIGNIVKISTPAIYKNIRKLAQSGYLESTPVKECDMPEKKVYTITEKGITHFHELLEKESKSSINYHFDFNSVIANLLNVECQEALKLIQNIETELLCHKTYLENAVHKYDKIPYTGKLLLKQHQSLNDALLNWIAEMKVTYENVSSLKSSE